MKLLITGHTSAIGSIIAEHYKDHEIIGVSRTSGYDLTNNSDIQKIIELSSTADHFINLANVGYSQCELLYGVHTKWKKEGKQGKIISFGTMTTSAPYKLMKQLPVDFDMTAYIGQKLALEKVHSELSVENPFGSQPHSVLIRFVNFGEKTGIRTGEPTTTKEQMLEIVDFVLNSKTYISSIDFREV
jgi:hypothetical protein